jgi:Transmembrane domain of unknown function (DUF3566)
VVTSRATGDDLTDDQETRQSDIMAPPRQSPRKPTAARSARAKTASPDDAASDGTADAGVSPNGTPAGGKEDAPARDASANGGPAAVDATIVDGVPALPADTIGPSRGTRPKGSGPAQETAGSKAGDQSPAGDSPAFSFGPPPSASAQPAVEDPTIAYPAESAVMPPGDDWPATAPAGTVPSGSASRSGTASPSGTGSPGRPPAGSRPAPAEPPSVSPAAFAWEMPDPPPNSPSSPARTFLRSGVTGKNQAARKAASAAAAGKTATGKTATGKTATGKTATGKSPAAARTAAQKAQSKRTARQAHLTIARVEPWSVMKFSFVVSIVAFVILFVAVSVLYSVLSALGVFDSLQHVVTSVTSSQSSGGVNAKAWFSASKVLGYTALLGSLNIVLITAMSTIGAVVYNLTSRLIGGVEVTLRETE